MTGDGPSLGTISAAITDLATKGLTDTEASEIGGLDVGESLWQIEVRGKMRSFLVEHVYGVVGDLPPHAERPLHGDTQKPEGLVGEDLDLLPFLEFPV